jgi:hypothetical protein
LFSESLIENWYNPNKLLSLNKDFYLFIIYYKTEEPKQGRQNRRYPFAPKMRLIVPQFIFANTTFAPLVFRIPSIMCAKKKATIVPMLI